MFRMQNTFKQIVRLSSSFSESFSTGGETLCEKLKRLHLKTNEPEVVKQHLKTLFQPIEYFTQQPSCPSVLNIAAIVNPWIGASDADVKKISDYWLDVFNVVVMLDDFLDGTDMRKGSASAHMKHGVPNTVLAGLLGHFTCFKTAMLLCPNSAEVVRDFYHDYWRGIGMEIYWRETSFAPTVDEYLGVTAVKWIVLQHTTTMLQLKVGDTQDLSDVVRMYSTFMGICNDYSDFVWNKYEGKKVCDDMTEGKFTMPAIHAHKIMGNEEIREILKKKSHDEKDKKRYVEILDKTGSFDYTKDFLVQLHKEITGKIKEIGENAEMQKAIDEEIKIVLTSQIDI